MRASIRLSCLLPGLLAFAACAPLATQQLPLGPPTNQWSQAQAVAQPISVAKPAVQSAPSVSQAPAQMTVRGQNAGGPWNQYPPASSANGSRFGGGSTQSPVAQTSFQAPPLPASNGGFPAPVAQASPVVAAPSLDGGPTPFISPNAVEPFVGPGGAQVVNPEGIVIDDPYHPVADIGVGVAETETGRFMFGVGVNSDAGLTGNIVIDERNFDLWGLPRSWSDVTEGRAFRGRGQGFRIEALPGTQVQRYMVNFSEPYLMGTKISLNVSGFFYDRRFFDWDEQRFGGRVGLGYRLSPDLSAAAALRMENVNIHEPRVTGIPQLDRVIGKSDLFSGRFSLTHDTRDVPFAPTEGHFTRDGFRTGVRQL